MDDRSADHSYPQSPLLVHGSNSPGGSIPPLATFENPYHDEPLNRVPTNKSDMSDISNISGTSSRVPT